MKRIFLIISLCSFGFPMFADKGVRNGVFEVQGSSDEIAQQYKRRNKYIRRHGHREALKRSVRKIKSSRNQKRAEKYLLLFLFAGKAPEMPLTFYRRLQTDLVAALIDKGFLIENESGQQQEGEQSDPTLHIPTAAPGDAQGEWVLGTPADTAAETPST